MKIGPEVSRRALPAETTGDAPDIDFHGASIINEFDEEIPITDTMVQQACDNYIHQWEVAHKFAVED